MSESSRDPAAHPGAPRAGSFRVSVDGIEVSGGVANLSLSTLCVHLHTSSAEGLSTLNRMPVRPSHAMPSPGTQSQESPASRRGVARRRLPRWHDLPLRTKGLAVIGIPVVPLLGIALVFVTMQGVQRRAEAQVTHTHDVKEALSAALISLLDAESSARGFVLTGNQTWLEPYERVRRELPGQFSRLQALVSDNPLSTARIGRIRALAEARLSTITSLLPYPSPAYPPESLLLEGHRRMEALRLEVTAMEGYENGLLAERQARSEGVRRKTQTLIGVAAGLGMAGGLCGVWLFTGGVARRVERVKDTASGWPCSMCRRSSAIARGLDQRVQTVDVRRWLTADRLGADLAWLTTVA